MEDQTTYEKTIQTYSFTNQLLSILPIMTLIFPALCFIATGMTYYFQGRFCNYIPTISETGTEYPNKIMFIFIFPAIALCSFYTMLIVMRYVEKEFGFSKIGKIWAKVTMSIGAIGLMLIGIFPLNENRTMHLASAGTGMFNVVLFELCIYFTIGNKDNKVLQNIRMFCQILQWIGGTIFGISSDILPNRVSTTISAIGEITCILMMQIYFFTFSRSICWANISVV